MRPLVYRPATGIVLTLAIWLTASLILGSLIAVGDGAGSQLRPLASFALSASWFTWVLFWWPRLQITADGIEVRNPFRTTRIPWDELQSLDERGNLSLITAAGRVTAWAAPIASRRRERRMEATARMRSRFRILAEATSTDSEPEAAETIRRVLSGRYVLAHSSSPFPTTVKTTNAVVLAVSVIAVLAPIISLWATK